MNFSTEIPELWISIIIKFNLPTQSCYGLKGTMEMASEMVILIYNFIKVRNKVGVPLGLVRSRFILINLVLNFSSNTF